MSHDHAHHHHVPEKVTIAFQIGILLNLVFVAIEAGVGIVIHSLSLVSDAAHNLADVGTLALSLLAFRLLKVKANSHYTYGYRKTSILVALFNSVILLFTIGWIFFEAVDKILHPGPLPGITIALVAGAGIVINGFTAFLFSRDKERDINIKSAYLHLVSDALVSAGIVVGGLIMWITDWFWIDSIISVAIALFILYSTWQLLTESLRLSLDGVPHDIHLEDIRKDALTISGIKDVHHVHIWALSSTENAMTAHLVLDQLISFQDESKIKHSFRHLMEHRHIQHVTLETEREDDSCLSENCGPDSVVESPLKHQEHS